VVEEPDIGEALAAAGAVQTLLEGVDAAGRVVFGRGRLAEHPAEVDEVLLGFRALDAAAGLGDDAAPLGLELVNVHGRRPLRDWAMGAGWRAGGAGKPLLTHFLSEDDTATRAAMRVDT
jgi:hypothetical protein